ncbi:MAG: DUF6675 family protein [Alkalispirochaeta sp.]|jgi:hypothetical protein
MDKYSLAIATLLVAIVAVIQVSADSQPEDRLPGGRTNFYTDTVETDLAPDSELTRRIVEDLRQLKPRIGIEIAVPIQMTDEAFTEEGMLELYNILRSISTMKGIEYYSVSKERMRVFYEESYAVDTPNSPQRIPDPVVTTIPRQETVYAFQKDSTFGTNLQRIDYSRSGDQTLLRMENVTTMVYKVIPMVTPGNLRIFLLVQPVPKDSTVWFYGNIGVRVPGLFGLQDRAQESFYNRIIALHDWFVQELTAAGLTQ